MVTRHPYYMPLLSLVILTALLCDCDLGGQEDHEESPWTTETLLTAWKELRARAAAVHDELSSLETEYQSRRDPQSLQRLAALQDTLTVEAESVFGKAARGGECRAAFALGSRYRHALSFKTRYGLPCDQDRDKALLLLRQSSDRGHPGATELLVTFEKSPEKALELRKAAAKLGCRASFAGLRMNQKENEGFVFPGVVFASAKEMLLYAMLDFATECCFDRLIRYLSDPTPLFAYSRLEEAASEEARADPHGLLDVRLEASKCFNRMKKDWTEEELWPHQGERIRGLYEIWEEEFSRTHGLKEPSREPK